MSLRITNLELPVTASETMLHEAIARRLQVRLEPSTQIRILRKSLDARSRENLRFVFTVEVNWPEAQVWLQRHKKIAGVEMFSPSVFEEPPTGTAGLGDRPVVVGSGPAGLLAAYYLAQRGYKPLIIERGYAVKERVPAIRAFDSGGDFAQENNYLFGEGGAGTFSDGKLTCRLSGPDVDWVLEQFVACGGKPAIRYEQRPHLGSNRLPMLVRNFRRKIEDWGGEYKFCCRLEGLDLDNGQLRGLQTSSGYIRTSLAVLAIGHSARDTYTMFHAAGLPMLQKAFQLGVRIEQPQAQVNQYKYAQPEYEKILGAADYTIISHGQRDVFSFCMCAGGIIIPSVSEPGMFCTNGMSNSRHDTPYANSGIMVTLEPREFGSEHPLAGVELQRKYERVAFELGRGNYAVPIQSAADFIQNRAPDAKTVYECSYPREKIGANLSQVLPEQVTQALRSGLPKMDYQWHGAFLKNAILVGPEMRGSAPVRIDRDKTTRQTPNIVGLFPVGEGAGYAGGIISAAVDGLRSAKAIVQQYAPLQSRNS